MHDQYPSQLRKAHNNPKPPHLIYSTCYVQYCSTRVHNGTGRTYCASIGSTSRHQTRHCCSRKSDLPAPKVSGSKNRLSDPCHTKLVSSAHTLFSTRLGEFPRKGPRGYW